MSAEQINEMKALTEALNEAARAYYNENREIISDKRYDELSDKLTRLENEAGFALPNSPTRNVGAPLEEGPLKKTPHETPLLSLDKTKSVADLKDFLGAETGVLSYKLDGLTVALTYENGVLKTALTRGDGLTGEVVTENAKLLFKNLPGKIPHDGVLSLRGEAVITFSDFNKINDALPDGKKYKNARNLVSGAVRQIHKTHREKCVSFFAFSVIKAERDFDDKKSNALLWLASLGFETAPYKTVDARNLESAVNAFAEQIASEAFGADGLVLTLDSISKSAELGATSKFPKDSIAFKWADETAETTLINIEWNTSRTGLINPVAVFEPVDLCGSTVTRASLHNAGLIEELELGRGDTVTVYKANMVIPQIDENITRRGGCLPPESCRTCGEKTALRQTAGGKFLYCENALCPAQTVAAFTHFVSREAMNIERLSAETIKKFIELGFFADFADIYKLERFKDDIVNMRGFGARSYENLDAAIRKSRSVYPHNLIAALGITQVGLANARLLCEHFSHDLDAITKATYDELASINGFGPVLASSLAEYFANPANIEQINELRRHLTFIPAAKKANALSGLIFVITGSLTGFENRGALKTVIENLGGKVTSAVTKNTSYLINNNPRSASEKNKKAAEHGVPVITENEFAEMFLKS